VAVPAAIPPKVIELLEAWRLIPDGSLLTTRSGWVLPVQHEGSPAMLKVARIPDEQAGYRVMTWWNGEGATKVFASSPDALLMERGAGTRDLAQMAWSGQDDDACRILCNTAARLHASRNGPFPELHPLDTWFQPLFQLASEHALLAPAAAIARELLAAPQTLGPLHGDLHHENVLDFGERGWLAIDPHGDRRTNLRLCQHLHEPPISAIQAGRSPPCWGAWRHGWRS